MFHKSLDSKFKKKEFPTINKVNIDFSQWMEQNYEIN